jgi:hypothetical protein
LSGYLEAELKALPDSLKALLPSGDVVTQLDWVTKAKAAGIAQAKKGGSGDGSPVPGGDAKSGFASIYKS